MIYTWLIGSIPSNATINSATLSIAGWVLDSPQGTSDVEFEVRTFPNSNYSRFPNTQWDAITSWTVLRTEQIPRNLDFNVGLSLNQTFIDYIQSSLSSGKLHLAFRATDEETFGTNKNVHYIDFKRPTSFNVETAVRITIYLDGCFTNLS